MLPWNPPSSFSSGNDLSSGQHQQQHQQQYRPNYEQNPQQPQPPQQQQQNSNQQQQQQQGANAAAAGQQQPPAYPPMTLSSTLHFLQSEHRRYARDRNEWEIERAEMRARIALLEGEKRGNEGALRDLGRRCKMLENALRGERSKFLSTTSALAQHSPSPSGTSSPVHIPPTGASGIPPAKAAQLLSNLNPSKDKEQAGKDSGNASPAPESAAMAPSTSSPGVAAPAPAPAVTVQPPGHQTRASSSLGMNGGTMNGTWNTAAGTLGGAAGTLGAGRDPRGKARSRDYLKQCLQEITYLTSATTLNPLSATSYSAPNVPRPRKVLPDHVLSGGAPGVFNVTFPPRAGSGDSSTAAGAAPSAPAPTAPPLPVSAAFELPPSQQQLAGQQQQQQQTPHPITKFPSDAASAFVPLKRTISQPGLPPVSSVRDLPPSSVSAPRVNSTNSASSDPFAIVGEPSSAVKKAESTLSATKIEGNAKDKASEKAEVEKKRATEQINEAASPATAEVGTLSQCESEYVETGIDPISLDGADTTSTLPSPTTASHTFVPTGAADLNEEGADSSSHPVALGDGRSDTVSSDGNSSRPGRTAAPSSEQWATLSRVGSRRGQQGGGKATGGAGNGGRDDERAARALDNGDLDVALGGVGSGEGAFQGTLRRGVGERGAGGDGDGASRLTAIFAPEGDEAWQEELRKAGEQQQGTTLTTNDTDLEDLTWDEEEKEDVKVQEGPMWKSRGVLRSHLDSVRALAFVKEDSAGLSLLSGGDDNTVKLWRGIKTTASKIASDVEPVITYRGHTSSVTSIAASTSTGLIYSASLDSSIRIWRLPAPDHQTYDPFDASTRVGLIEGSGSAVWGLVLFEENREERLASIASDGLVSIWDTTKREKVRSWGYDGVKQGSTTEKMTPTALELVKARDGRPQQLAVAYFNAVVKLFDPSTGKETMVLQSGESSDGTSRTQINQIASHPLKPLLATAHESREIQLFDLETGQFLSSILGHADPITSITFLPASCSIASVSTDLRFHDADLTFTQDIALARAKSEEGILAVVAHESEPVLAIGGADSCVRLFVRE